MKNKLFYLIVLISNSFQIACSQTKEPITVEQVPSEYSTILFTEKDEITGIRFYLAFDITNNTKEQINLSFPEYVYNKNYTRDSYLGWIRSIHMYFNHKGKLETVFDKDMDGLEMLDNKPKEYIFTTFHAPIKDLSIQSMFSSYLDQMKAENKDTLHIGTISELKAKNSPILQLLEGDSLIISFDKKGFYIDPIPVQIK